MPEVEVFSPIFGKNIDLVSVIIIGCFLLFQFARLKRYIPVKKRRQSMMLSGRVVWISNMEMRF
jgi:hypothetical protein